MPGAHGVPGEHGATSPVAVITGAAGGIGRELMAVFAAAGHRVVGLDLPEALPPGDDRFRGVDLTDDAAVRAVFDGVVADLGRIDVLINNAGVTAIGAFTDHDASTHAKVLAVNYLAAVSCTQAALPALVESGGRVVVTSSVTGFAPTLGRPAYVAAKHAVTGLFNSVRPELAAHGVGVTLVHPTFVAGPDTGMGEASGRPEGARRSTTGPEVTARQVAQAVLDGVRRGRDQVLVGRTAHLAWRLNRFLPGTYMRLMTRRLNDGA